MQEHGFSFEVEATPMEVWKALHPRLPTMPPGERFVIEHGEVRIEIVHPGDADGARASCASAGSACPATCSAAARRGRGR